MDVPTPRVQDFFIQSLQSVGLYTENLQQLLEVLSKDHYILFSFQKMQYLMPLILSPSVFEISLLIILISST